MPGIVPHRDAPSDGGESNVEVPWHLTLADGIHEALDAGLTRQELADWLGPQIDTIADELGK